MMTSTDIFREILSAAKALAVHHGITNDLGDDFDRWLGLGLAERFAESKFLEADYHLMGQALRFHCGFMTTAAFANAAIDRHVEMPFYLDSEDRFEDDRDCPGSLLFPTMDIFELALRLRESQEMLPNWGPFRGAAGVLWDAGMDDVDPASPVVERANAELACLLLGISAQSDTIGEIQSGRGKAGFRGLMKRLFG